MEIPLHCIRAISGSQSLYCTKISQVLRVCDSVSLLHQMISAFTLLSPPLCVMELRPPFLQEKLNISCVHTSAITELFRGIRAQMCNLITGLSLI